MIKITNFKNTKKFTKVNIAKVPIDKAIVYKLKNNSGKNIYTGVAGRGRGEERLLEHKDKKGEIIPGATKFQIAQIGTQEQALKVEKQIVKKEQPRFNTQYKF